MQQQSSHFCVIDLETAGPYPDAIIFSMGLTFGEYKRMDNAHETFWELVKSGLYVKFDAMEQRTKLGRSFNQDTMDWWKKQGDDARKVLSPAEGDVSVLTIPDIFDQYFKDKPVRLFNCDIYDRRSFDLSKLEHVYKENIGRDKYNWSYMREYEVSTAMRFLGLGRYGNFAPDAIPGMIYHNALHDAALDHIRINDALTGVGALS